MFHDFDHSDRSSWVGKFSNHFTVMTFFQVKPEQQPPAKTGKINIDLTKVTTKGKLPCQEKQQFFVSKKYHAIVNLIYKRKENGRFRKLSYHYQCCQKYVFQLS